MDGDRLVREGLIRHVGVSNYSTAQITEFAAVLPAETSSRPMAPPRSSASACGPDLVLYEACASGS